MIQLSGAGKRFGAKLLFEDVDWLITARERTGLVGGNGTGKSTLLKIIAGSEPLDYGARTAMKGVRIGYLPQDGLQVRGRTVFAECMSVFGEVKELEDELERLTAKMSELDPASGEYREVAERFERAESELRARDGYALEAQVGTVLTGLGFRREDWGRQTEEFSGGWQMRIALAKLLLEKPNLLLLDEPTNHLDIEARNWLEDYLVHYDFAYVLISHDRYFLDVTVNKIAEIWNKKVTFYNGNYEQYRRQKAERLAQLEAAYRNQQDKIQQLETFINRFRYQATKARQVQSRIKELERMERIELPPEEKTIHFSFPQPKASGRVVAECKDVSKCYGDKPVFKRVSFTIERGDRIALVGVNGAGKSTLIRLLSGMEPPSSGSITLGHNVTLDYFAQDQYKALHADARILDDLSEAAPKIPQTELRNLLGCFLFSEDEVFKKIGVLSGGERNRYALARLLVHPANFLLLDEPTNHLDMRAKDVLLEALQNFTGTLVFVSHDRYFIDHLANRVFEIADQEVRAYPGTYEDYLWRKKNEAESAAAFGIAPAGAASESSSTLTQKPAAAKRINPIKLKQMQDEAKRLEEHIAALEAQIQQSELALSEFAGPEEAIRLAHLLESQRAELEQAMAQWESVAAQLEAIA
jgi:ATP-binding cassette subfamily F protein 3